MIPGRELVVGSEVEVRRYRGQPPAWEWAPAVVTGRQRFDSDRPAYLWTIVCADGLPGYAYDSNIRVPGQEYAVGNPLARKAVSR